MVVYVLQVVIAFAYLIRYDLNKTPDVIGIEAAKRHLKRLFGIKDDWSVGKILGALGSLLFLVYAVSVPSLFLCFRKEGQKGFTTNGVYLILAGVAVKTIVYYKINVSAWVTYKAVVKGIYRMFFG